MIRRRQSLQARLTLTYAFALAAGLVLFAVVSLAAIDETLKTTLDARLGTASRGFVATLSVRRGDLALADDTNHRLLTILGVQLNGGVLLADGRVPIASAIIPSVVRRVAAEATGADPVYATVYVGGSPLRVIAVPIPKLEPVHGTALIWRASDFIGDYKRIAAIVFGGAILAIVTAVMTVGAAVARRGLAPLREMADLASEIEAHDLSRRLAVPSSEDELGTLCLAFNRMLDRLQSAFERQRQFTADASHDLRAPLAVIRAEIDLSLRRERTAEEYRASLVSIRAEIAELERLIEALLLVARTDAGIADLAEVDVDELAAESVRRMQTFAASRAIAIVANLQAHRVVSADPDVLERVLISLLHNAVKFARDGGRVALETTADDVRAILIVRDDGAGFTDEALAHAFDRFWRGDSARGRGGSGLGLAIAKTAVERWGGRIDLRNAPGGGGEVRIALPSIARSERVRLHA